MIAVIAKASQREAVEELFELFKTPWEFYQDGCAYDVVVSTAADVPVPAGARLLIVSGAAATAWDAREHVVSVGPRRAGAVRHDGTRLPLYGETLTFVPQPGQAACVTSQHGIVGLRFAMTDASVIRLGYDLFDEVRLLLSHGQPVEHAEVPTLDRHIGMLREWIVGAGVTLIEIPPTPAGYPFAVCLTHDIDFIGIRQHCFDHTMWGFLYRSSVGALWNLLRGRLSLRRAARMWRAAASLPFVYLGWARDFWEPFAWYLRVETGLPATYFLIPFKRRAGDHVTGRYASRRATAYDVADLTDWTATLQKSGCELGVHGIDAWHSVEKGRDERARLEAVTGASRIGVRMHWLLHDERSSRTLEAAGYTYDSTSGYNDAVGYRAGTSQVFRPVGAQTLLELPMHIQDGALFYGGRLDLTEPEAWARCQQAVEHALQAGGVVTVLWHDRSHGPERFWGDFYIRLVEALRSSGAWFATAGDLVEWFRRRRAITFTRAATTGGVRATASDGGELKPSVRVRTYHPVLQQDGTFRAQAIETEWNGVVPLELAERSATAVSPDRQAAISQLRYPLSSI